MAEERIIKIVGDTSDADKKIKDTNENLKDLNKTAETTSETTSKGVENVGKASKKSTKNVGFLTNGFKKLGFALKAAGIGLVISLVAALGAAFSKNQRFLDAFNTVTETLSIVLSQVANALFDVYDSVSKNKEEFNALGKVLNALLTISVTPLKLAFYGIKLAIQEGQLAWEQSFFGGNDKKKIAELIIGITDTKQAIIDTGKDAIQAGKDYVLNFGEAIIETANIAKKTQEELSKINIKNAKEQAKNIINLQKASELAEAKLAGLTLKYQKDAEIQRQIRDDVRLSIEDRIKANDELGRILEEQTKEELKLANIKLSLAGQQLSVDKNKIENQVAYQQALNEVADVEERITGQKSEQIVNEASLLDERKANLQELINIGKTEQELAEQEALTKLENQKTLIERTVSDEEQKNEFLLNAETEYQNTLNDIQKEAKNKRDKIKEEETKKKQEEDAKKIQLEEDVANAKKQIGLRSLALLTELAGRGSKIGKALAITQTTISGIEGVQNAFTTASKSPITTLFPAYPFIQAGLAGAFSAVQIQKIASSNANGSGGVSGGSSVSQSQPSSPSFNLVQGTGSNQIAQSITQDKQPVKAYVVGSDVTTQQQLDRNKVSIGSI